MAHGTGSVEPQIQVNLTYHFWLKDQIFLNNIEESSGTRYLEEKFESSESYDLWPIDQSSSIPL